ncbi:Uncharacterised protein [Vibrio cholerae]|nr:Uncharacterised protein [Vibrio cholerae]
MPDPLPNVRHHQNHPTDRLNRGFVHLVQSRLGPEPVHPLLLRSGHVSLQPKK